MMFRGIRNLSGMVAKLLIVTLVFSILSIESPWNDDVAYGRSVLTEKGDKKPKPTVSPTVTPKPKPTPPPSKKSAIIVHDGQANAVIIVDADAESQILKAAKTLAVYLEKSTGATLPIMNAGDFAATNPAKDFVRI